MDDKNHEAIVKLYFVTEDAAEAAATGVRAKGLAATVGRPQLPRRTEAGWVAVEGAGWVVTVEGAADAVLAFGERQQDRLQSQ